MNEWTAQHQHDCFGLRNNLMPCDMSQFKNIVSVIIKYYWAFVFIISLTDLVYLVQNETEEMTFWT